MEFDPELAVAEFERAMQITRSNLRQMVKGKHEYAILVVKKKIGDLEKYASRIMKDARDQNSKTHRAMR